MEETILPTGSVAAPIASNAATQPINARYSTVLCPLRDRIPAACGWLGTRHHAQSSRSHVISSGVRTARYRGDNGLHEWRAELHAFKTSNQIGPGFIGAVVVAYRSSATEN